MQTRARNAGRVDFVSGLAQKLTAPLSTLLARTADGSSDFLNGLAHASSLRREVRDLRAQAQVIADYTAQTQRLESEIDDLRRLQGYGPVPGKIRLPAEVVGIFAYDNRITISVGSNDGVKANMPVVSARGLLGVVQSVDPQRSQVLLLTSPLTKIGAIALRTPPPFAFLKGENASSLIGDFLDPKTTAQNGDEVVTSGFSEWIPRGIPIGRIIRIEDNPDFGTERAVVYPWATLGTTREVFVLK